MRIIYLLLAFSLQLSLGNAMTQKQCKDFALQAIENIPGWCSAKKAQAMMDLIFEVQPSVCVEMGVFAGASLFPTAYALKQLNQGIVYAIDAWDTQIAIKYYPEGSDHKNWWQALNMRYYYRACKQMIAFYKLQDYCTIIKKPFIEALEQIPDIDILHIDATHTNEGDFADTIAYIDKVKNKGYIWFDGWAGSFDTYEYLKTKTTLKKVIDSGNCILLQKQ